MALIPFVPFTSGAVFTPEVANAIAVPVFDDQVQYFGHLAKIKDTDLDSSVTGIFSRVASNELNLKVTAGSGLNALYASGRAIYGTTVFTIIAGSLSLTASATNYIYINTAGQILSSAVLPPTVRALVATVATNTTGVTVITDLREGYKLEPVKPLTSSVKNFGGRGDSGAFVAAGGEVLADGEYYFTDFTVAAGLTISIDKLARIYCTGNALIAGTVNVMQASRGGGAVINQSGSTVGGAGQGGGGGFAESVPATYNHLASPVGSGGGGGYASRDFTGGGTIYTAVGGDGGGCCWIEAAGSITISGSIFADGTGGANGTVSASITPGTLFGTGAAGGGSGGLVLLKALNSIIVSGTISAKGGNGGNGVPGDINRSSESGGGGGGGRIVMFAPNINTTGSSLDRSGGSAGSSPALASNFPFFSSVGGSYGGLGGGSAGVAGNGQQGAIGILVTRNFTPIG